MANKGRFCSYIVNHWVVEYRITRVGINRRLAKDHEKIICANPGASHLPFSGLYGQAGRQAGPRS